MSNSPFNKRPAGSLQYDKVWEHKSYDTGDAPHFIDVLKRTQEWKPSASYKAGETYLCEVEKRGLRRLWARLTGKPLTELKQFRCVAVHTGTNREDFYDHI